MFFSEILVLHKKKIGPAQPGRKKFLPRGGGGG